MGTCREYWVEMLLKIADPVLINFDKEQLHQSLQLEESGADREQYKGLEILGRTLSGLAPWLEAASEDYKEEALRQKYAKLSRRAVEVAVNPASADYCFLGTTEKEWNKQWLVDAAYLAMAVIRAPKELGDKLSPEGKQNLVAAFLKTRNYRPVFNNWLLFSATIEAALYVLGQDYDLMRIDYAIRQMEQWYVGDGFYSDGPRFRMDYYNSFAIQPMLTCLVRMFHDKYTEPDAVFPEGEPVGEKMFRLVMTRFLRYVRIQEEFIAPDGSFAPVGRSMVYRCGAFQALAQAALWHTLPEEVSPAMARCALTKVIQKTLDAPGTFTTDGWLQMGLCGSQPDIAYAYNTTASLYMATLAFLPLGLPATDRFWTDADEMTTWEKCFSGVNAQKDIPIVRDERLF